MITVKIHNRKGTSDNRGWFKYRRVITVKANTEYKALTEARQHIEHLAHIQVLDSRFPEQEDHYRAYVQHLDDDRKDVKLINFSELTPKQRSALCTITRNA